MHALEIYSITVRIQSIVRSIIVVARNDSAPFALSNAIVIAPLL
jgi:hypothetical protein